MCAPPVHLQVCQLVGSSGMAAVAKDAVLPLFESAGRLHLALTSVFHAVWVCGVLCIVQFCWKILRGLQLTLLLLLHHWQ